MDYDTVLLENILLYKKIPSAMANSIKLSSNSLSGSSKLKSSSRAATTSGSKLRHRPARKNSIS